MSNYVTEIYGTTEIICDANQTKCNHKCYDQKPNGFLNESCEYECNQGYELNSENGNCEPVLECINNAQCDGLYSYCTSLNKCYTCNANTPFYDLNTNTCISCPDDKPLFENKECKACPAGSLFTNGTCKTCYEIDSSKPMFNIETKACEVCPSDLPYVNPVTKNCEIIPIGKYLHENKLVDTCPDGYINDTTTRTCKQAPVEEEKETEGISMTVWIIVGIILLIIAAIVAFFLFGRGG